MEKVCLGVLPTNYILSSQPRTCSCLWLYPCIGLCLGTECDDREGMDKEALFPHHSYQFPESQRVHSFKSASCVLVRYWAIPSFQQRLSHKNPGGSPSALTITLLCEDYAMWQLGGARSKASGGCLAIGFSLDSGLAIPWHEQQEAMNHPPARRGRLGQHCDPCLKCALCHRLTTPREW